MSTSRLALVGLDQGRTLQARRSVGVTCAISGHHLLHCSLCQLHGRRCSQAWLHVWCICMHASSNSICLANFAMHHGTARTHLFGYPMAGSLHHCCSSHLLSLLITVMGLSAPGAADGVLAGACGPLTGSGACALTAAAAPAGSENLDFVPDMGVRALQAQQLSCMLLGCPTRRAAAFCSAHRMLCI